MSKINKNLMYEVEKIKKEAANNYELIIRQYQEIIQILDNEYWDNKELTEYDKRSLLYLIMYYQRFINDYDKLIDDLNY